MSSCRSAYSRGVIASPVIFSAYGFWLPNDPRGSWSDFVGSWELLRFGGATQTDIRQSVAWAPHDTVARLAAKGVLKYPPVAFTGQQALAVSRGFQQMIDKSAYAVYACSILPDHVHMVIARHDYGVERIVGLLKGEASRELEAAGLHPMSRWRQSDGALPTPWGKRCWKVFLNCNEAVLRAIRYVEQNPVKEGKRPQRWPFVVPFVPT